MYSQKCNFLSSNVNTELFSRCFVLGPFCQTLIKAVFPSRVVNASLCASRHIGQVNVLLSRVRCEMDELLEIAWSLHSQHACAAQFLCEVDMNEFGGF